MLFISVLSLVNILFRFLVLVYNLLRRVSSGRVPCIIRLNNNLHGETLVVACGVGQ